MAISAGSNIEAADFIDSSAGAADAGKGVKLDAAGAIDHSMIPDPTPANGTDVGATIPTTLRTNSSGQGQLHIVSFPANGGSSGTVTVEAKVDGVVVATYADNAVGSNCVGMLVFFVPNGSTYQLVRGIIGTASTGVITNWKVITMP